MSTKEDLLSVLIVDMGDKFSGLRGRSCNLLADFQIESVTYFCFQDKSGPK